RAGLHLRRRRRRRPAVCLGRAATGRRVPRVRRRDASPAVGRLLRSSAMDHATAPLHPTARALRDIVGANACLVDTQGIAPYVTDYRGLYRGSAVCVVLPSSTQAVSEVLA